MHNGQQAFEVVIVGGGPGGATAGMLLARQRRSVLIIDKARFPRDKPCAGLLSGRAAGTLTALYGEDVLARLTRAMSTDCRMFNGYRLLSEAVGGDKTYAVMRREMDALLLDRARQSGCRVWEDSRVVALDREEPAVTLASGQRVRGSIIIGADGAGSITATGLRHAERTKYGKRPMAIGLVAEAPVERLKTAEVRAACRRSLHLFLGIVPWGYGWIFPKGETVSVGVGGFPRRAIDLGNSFQALVNEYFEAGTWQSLRISGHPVPMGNLSPLLGRGNLLLVGDAAGLVEPITGEGIAFALQSGAVAAQAATEALARSSPGLAAGIYAARIRRSILLHLRQAAVAGWLLFPRPCFPLAMRILAGRPRVLEYYLQILSGKLTYPAFFRRVMREVLFGQRPPLPRAASARVGEGRGEGAA